MSNKITKKQLNERLSAVEDNVNFILNQINYSFQNGDFISLQDIEDKDYMKGVSKKKLKQYAEENDIDLSDCNNDKVEIAKKIFYHFSEQHKNNCCDGDNCNCGYDEGDDNGDSNINDVREAIPMVTTEQLKDFLDEYAKEVDFTIIPEKFMDKLNDYIMNNGGYIQFLKIKRHEEELTQEEKDLIAELGDPVMSSDEERNNLGIH